MFRHSRRPAGPSRWTARSQQPARCVTPGRAVQPADGVESRRRDGLRRSGSPGHLGSHPRPFGQYAPRVREPTRYGACGGRGRLDKDLMDGMQAIDPHSGTAAEPGADSNARRRTARRLPSCCCMPSRWPTSCAARPSSRPPRRPRWPRCSRPRRVASTTRPPPTATPRPARCAQAEARLADASQRGPPVDRRRGRAGQDAARGRRVPAPPDPRRGHRVGRARRGPPPPQELAGTRAEAERLRVEARGRRRPHASPPPAR